MWTAKIVVTYDTFFCTNPLFCLCYTLAEPYCDDCTNADVNADVYYTGDVEEGELQDELYNEFIEHCEEIAALEGVAHAWDPCDSITVVPIGGDGGSGGGGGDGDGGSGGDGGGDGGSGGGGDSGGDGSDGSGGDQDRGGDDGIIGIEDASPSEEDDSMAAAGIFGIVFAALVLMALLALLLRRRRNRRNADSIPKHQSFEDEVGANETFMLDNASRSYEDDSRFGMYPEGQGEGMLLGQRAMNQDVHKCSSATCELCEQARQSGLQFLPTKASPKSARMSLAGSTRAYSAEDTVEL